MGGAHTVREVAPSSSLCQKQKSLWSSCRGSWAYFQMGAIAQHCWSSSVQSVSNGSSSLLLLSQQAFLFAVCKRKQHYGWNPGVMRRTFSHSTNVVHSCPVAVKHRKRLFWPWWKITCSRTSPKIPATSLFWLLFHSWWQECPLQTQVPETSVKVRSNVDLFFHDTRDWVR